MDRSHQLTKVRHVSRKLHSCPVAQLQSRTCLARAQGDRGLSGLMSSWAWPCPLAWNDSSARLWQEPSAHFIKAPPTSQPASAGKREISPDSSKLPNLIANERTCTNGNGTATNATTTAVTPPSSSTRRCSWYSSTKGATRPWSGSRMGVRLPMRRMSRASVRTMVGCTACCTGSRGRILRSWPSGRVATLCRSCRYKRTTTRNTMRSSSCPTRCLSFPRRSFQLKNIWPGCGRAPGTTTLTLRTRRVGGTVSGSWAGWEPDSTVQVSACKFRLNGQRNTGQAQRMPWTVYGICGLVSWCQVSRAAGSSVWAIHMEGS
ncbi:hypothetical protein Vretifemale_18394 [Volvox reticuliferus]|uniref:Uncharacterized protein n=1 Tax=Volvox reticuliferus TaxID=1737510 RepID=A0A8J4FVD3_9CHLO|nr:hypothetical protein Vretifemale_18394 [Volvox reticuliferus]